VKAAADAGEIPTSRLDSWRKLKRELAFQKRREDPAVAAAEKRKWKAINKSLKKHPKHKR
jgi:ribosome biogenesis GTPase / thiamine phosphate phosphatase